MALGSCNKMADVPLCGWNFKVGSRETKKEILTGNEKMQEIKWKRLNFASLLKFLKLWILTIVAVAEQRNKTAAINITINTWHNLLGPLSPQLQMFHPHKIQEHLL